MRTADASWASAAAWSCYGRGAGRRGRAAGEQRRGGGGGGRDVAWRRGAAHAPPATTARDVTFPHPVTSP